MALLCLYNIQIESIFLLNIYLTAILFLVAGWNNLISKPDISSLENNNASLSD